MILGGLTGAAGALGAGGHLNGIGKFIGENAGAFLSGIPSFLNGLQQGNDKKWPDDYSWISSGDDFLKEHIYEQDFELDPDASKRRLLIHLINNPDSYQILSGNNQLAGADNVTLERPQININIFLEEGRIVDNKITLRVKAGKINPTAFMYKKIGLSPVGKPRILKPTTFHRVRTLKPTVINPTW